MASHFKQSYIEDSNYETQASPMAAESITKLHTGQGAQKFAAKPKERKGISAPARGVLIGVALAALLVIAGGFLLVRALLGSQPVNGGDSDSDAFPAEPQQIEVTVDESTGVVDAGSVEYMGETYSMMAVEGGVAVVEIDEDGGQRSLFIVAGEPVSMFFYNGVLLVPENLHDGWDVIAYAVGAESQASPVVMDGSPVKGQGEITEVHLEGSELVVSDSAGANTRIPL